MKLSIIVPVYNSSKIISELVVRINKTMQKINLQKDFELLLINDNSQDDSWKKIEILAADYTFIKGICLDKNYGQHNAVMAGLNNSKGDLILTMDDDLQHPPEFILDILSKLKHCDVCYTNYKNRKHIGWKRAASIINNYVSSFLLNKSVDIYMSSFRGLKKSVVKKIIKFKEPNVYLDGLIILATKNIKIIEVEHHVRKHGKSNYTLKKLFVLWSNMILNFSFFPLRFASFFGLILKIFVKIFRKKNKDPQYKIFKII